jgi:ABC-type multidrug transport system ATPase subunit
MGMVANITLVHNNAVNSTFTVDSTRTVAIVGRGQNCNIRIDDAAVSSQHGQFFFTPQGVFYADLGSTNGSYINNNKLSTEATPLQNGTVVCLSGINSHIQFRVSLEASPGGTPTPQPIPQAYGVPGGRPVGTSLIIGRDPSCDIVLHQIGASRFHAKLTTAADGVYITDNHSTNGTFVNGVRITRPQKITGYDNIFIGGARFELKDGMLAADDNSERGLPVYVNNLGRRVTVKGAEKRILNNITLDIQPNEFVAVIGGSGAGKSTLMNILCGKTTAYDGFLAYDKSGMANTGAYKSAIGFAPQSDILYDDLTLYRMLYYSAKLKMPQDTRKEEYDNRVNQAIAMVQLTGHENTMVKNLSGGQRKRASIAVELLSDPRLFFLDEPTSGLDPATERHLMRLLKEMTRKNKTILAITHMTQNIGLCDKVIVLGRGGVLCYFGTPGDAIGFFGVTDVIDIYDKVDSEPLIWQQKYLAQHAEANKPVTANPHHNIKIDRRIGYNSGFSQFSILSARYIKLIFGDAKRVFLLLAQAPILGILLMLVAHNSYDGEIFNSYRSANSMMFALTCAAFWVGMLNSIQEICKERVIFEREKMTAVRTFPYIASKVAVISVISMIQAFLFLAVMQLFGTEFPTNNFDIPPFLGFYITICLTILSAAYLGLLVSTFSPNADRAMAVAPLLILPQILFSGAVFKLSGAMSVISNIIPCKLAMQGFGVLSDFNVINRERVEVQLCSLYGTGENSCFICYDALPSKFRSETISMYVEEMYDMTAGNLAGSWMGLIISAAAYVIIFSAALNKRKKAF